MIVRNEATGAMNTPPETKRVDLGWFEKCDDSQNELLYLEELLAIDRALQECDNILSEVNLQIGYKSHAQKIYETAEKRQHLWNFIKALPDYIETHLDEPLRQSLNHGACETISRIHMKDFTVENTLGLTISPYDANYMGQPQHKDRLSLEDFIGNALGEEAEGNAISGRNRECVEEFSAIFASQYDNLLALGILEDETALETYLDQFAVEGEYDHKEDQPFHLTLVSNLLDLTIIKPIIESCCGYDLITKEDLTEMEQNLKLAGALVDLITLATGLYGFASAGKNLGMKQMARLAMVELTADVTATTVATIGEYRNWPPGLTLLLSLGAGITVGQIGNHIIFKKDGVEIFRKEITERGTDVHHEIDEEEIFYDDIFEQQRRVDLEYEDYLEELRQLQNESDILFEGGSDSIKSNLINKIKEIRDKMPNTNLAKRGNMAVADVNVPGIKDNFVAHSKINAEFDKGADVAEFSYLKSENERIFTTYVDDQYPRYHDTEAKILEDIASQITDSNISGTINLYSELLCCQSCSNIILEFRRKFPNIKLNVYVE